VVIKRLRYPMVVWITLQRHPSVIAIRVADAVMPFRGIRLEIMAHDTQLKVILSWANIGDSKDGARGRIEVETRLARWLEVESGVAVHIWTLPTFSPSFRTMICYFS
jgi:hypothetical protein